MDGVSVRPAQAADAAYIARLFYESFRPEIAQFLIYGCKGAPEYIRMQLACAHSESAYFVAQSNSALIGAAELRRQPEGLLLNYIAVSADHRHQRVGPALLSCSIRMLGFYSGSIQLDVLDDNLPALGWYERIGFSRTGSSEFLEITCANALADSAAYVSGLPQAEICQERFGFSAFNLVTASGTFAIGRMGDDWFRLNDAAAVGRPEVHAILTELDPKRRVFAILSRSAHPRCTTVLAKTHRMQTEIGSLLSILRPGDYEVR